VNRVFVTTSWDDGHALDLRVANLLKKYQLKGTFYVPKVFEGRLAEPDIALLSQEHEIGAHTINHKILTDLEISHAQMEIEESKTWLETVTRQEIISFCYPWGKYSDEIVSFVKDAGFSCARTVAGLSISKPANPWLMPTTLHVYPFPFRKRGQKAYHWRRLLQPVTRDFFALRKLHVPFYKMRSWVTLTKSVFDATLQQGDYFHLWGHSWEIELYGMWDDLEEIFRYIARRKECMYVNNSQVIKR